MIEELVGLPFSNFNFAMPDPPMEEIEEEEEEEKGEMDPPAN
jgi:hypothetical protein